MASTFQRGELPHWSGINTFLKAPYLADCVVFLEARPGRVGEIIQNPVPHPRDPEKFLSLQFLAMKRQLERLIHPPDKSENASAITIRRRTMVGDDVF